MNHETEKISINAKEKHKNVAQYYKFLDLISKGYEFSEEELKRMPLSFFDNSEVLGYALKKLNIFDNNIHDKYNQRLCYLLTKAITNVPKIETFKQVIDVYAEKLWAKYKEDNMKDYTNIFGKICTQLRNYDNYDDSIMNMPFLQTMEYALKDKYTLLLDSMKDYHTSIHYKQMENIDIARNEIAKYSALYVSISKENYKKQITKMFYDNIKYFFIPKKSNKLAYKRITELKKRKEFKRLYINGDDSVNTFLDNLKKQYKEEITEDKVAEMVDNFLRRNYSKMESFIEKPIYFYEYKRMLEANKLVNRLNKKYIKYSDSDVTNYLDVIKYNPKTDTYYYAGDTFSEEEITKFQNYEKQLQIFNKIKKKIILESKEMKVSEDIKREELLSIKNDLPFNDEFFTFDNIVLEKLTLENLIRSLILENSYIRTSSFTDDESYDLLTTYIIDNGLIWLLLLYDKYEDLLHDCIFIDTYEIFLSFNYMKKIVSLAKTFNYDIHKYENIVTLYELSKFADDLEIAILGKDVILKLCEYQEFTNRELQDTIEMAKELVCEMVKRDKSTVPYVSGKTNNYLYSVYDSQDETVLLSGIDTNACFKINGIDNDFLHYCVLDKNGFVIKITDILGNFIGRASGFRSGNFIYINQLRTIYDELGEYNGDSKYESGEILEAFKEACKEIIISSQNNKNEKNKIDYIFSTKSYILSNNLEVNSSIKTIIGKTPLFTECTDWESFVKNTKNLLTIENVNDFFQTDYDNYKLTCIASVNNSKNVNDIEKKDVKALYDRVRNKIIITNVVDEKIINKVNKIKGIYSYLNNTKFEGLKTSKGPIVFLGDNWYIVFYAGKIIDSCILDFDNNAVLEYEQTKNTLSNYLTGCNEKIIEIQKKKRLL